MPTPKSNFDYQLLDRYDYSSGRVFLTGTQALVRIMLEQARRDRSTGLNTAGFVSGYRGSPLGALDLELWRINDRLKQDRIDFMPAVNEDLAAAAVLGAQQAVLDPDCEVEGVFSMWYGKGPGVDRSGDALRHGNAYGSSPNGGVLVVAGDDHGCVSSSMPHQSDVAFMTWFMPTLNPASVGEYLQFGEFGLALSRYSGAWVGFKAISETVESGRSVDLHPDRQFHLPAIELPPAGLHVRKADLPSLEIETRIGFKLKAVEAFVEANPIDRQLYAIPAAIYGIVTTGKSHLDLLEALRLLGLDEDNCRRLGIDIYKVGMVWPLARRDALNFVRGKAEVLVIEEKRRIIESQFKEYFYDWPGDKPEKMVGKYDAQETHLNIPWTGELSPLGLVPIIATRLARFFPAERLVEKAQKLTSPTPDILNVPGATRTPYFCSGCPHNTSTKIPAGSQAASGIGCHVMASWMDRNTEGYAQMGGEGVPWVVRSKFNGGKHMFQNLGEGTWYHSGSLAIRQAVAAGTNITYKILYNDAVAMTGGQPVDGPISVSGIAYTCRAEGIDRIAIVSDDIDKFKPRDFPSRVSFHDRSQLDPLQRELREVEGVSVLIFEQACATEKRRRRKRGEVTESRRFAYINSLVCEGCGDCSVESNCLSVEPRETEFGRKRRINLSSCNKDFSCLNGFCPSFVTVEGAERSKPDTPDLDLDSLSGALREPEIPSLEQPYNLLIPGVGGTGIVTLGALITMAAHLDGLSASVLDFTGFSQKFGTVVSYIRIASAPGELNQVRIEKAATDAVIGCDIAVCSAPKASLHYARKTRMVLNTAEMPTGDLVLSRDADLRVSERLAGIGRAIGSENLATLDANRIAEKLLGDSVFGNIIMLGYAWQQGLVPVSLTALERALELNGVEPAKNWRAITIGRLMQSSPASIQSLLGPSVAPEPTIAELIEKHAAFLGAYQDQAYADRYRRSIDAFRSTLPVTIRDEFAMLAAKSLFKLLAYKDEYEVARLHIKMGFDEELRQNFSGDYRIRYHLSPPFLPLRRDARGRPEKHEFGAWIRPVLRLIAALKGLRGTWFDPFGYTRERRINRELIAWYENILNTLVVRNNAGDHQRYRNLLKAPLEMRGFGPVFLEAVVREKKKAEREMADLVNA